jgi:hypothetical protein
MSCKRREGDTLKALMGAGSTDSYALVSDKRYSVNHEKIYLMPPI